MIAGQLAYVLSFRRPLMALLARTYCQNSGDGLRPSAFKMGTRARNELLCSALLLTFSIANLRVDYADTLYAVDASPMAWGGAWE